MKIAVTVGEPAGIGPDLLVSMAQRDLPCDIEFIGSRTCLEDRAAALDLPLDEGLHGAGRLSIRDVPLAVPVVPGKLASANAMPVLRTLNLAAAGCLDGEYAAMVTAPVHKAVINDAGVPFSGHTEYLAEKTGGNEPVMVLVADTLRVALVTTHLPLRQVPEAVTSAKICYVIKQLATTLRRQLGIARPRILVCGLNPHAGEDGHLGTEDRDVIGPAIAEAACDDVELVGPCPADTAFTAPVRATTDGYVAMYHDQGLTPLKALGFGHAVNWTLGLPIIRTSVDHGTALDLAGSGRADPGSLDAALALATQLAGVG